MNFKFNLKKLAKVFRSCESHRFNALIQWLFWRLNKLVFIKINTKQNWKIYTQNLGPDIYDRFICVLLTLRNWVGSVWLLQWRSGGGPSAVFTSGSGSIQTSQVRFDIVTATRLHSACSYYHVTLGRTFSLFFMKKWYFIVIISCGCSLEASQWDSGCSLEAVLIGSVSMTLWVLFGSIPMRLWVAHWKRLKEHPQNHLSCRYKKKTEMWILPYPGLWRACWNGFLSVLVINMNCQEKLFWEKLHGWTFSGLCFQDLWGLWIPI